MEDKNVEDEIDLITQEESDKQQSEKIDLLSKKLGLLELLTQEENQQLVNEITTKEPDEDQLIVYSIKKSSNKVKQQ